MSTPEMPADPFGAPEELVTIMKGLAQIHDALMMAGKPLGNSPAPSLSSRLSGESGSFWGISSRCLIGQNLFRCLMHQGFPLSPVIRAE
jgi:hypothetical protein